MAKLKLRRWRAVHRPTGPWQQYMRLKHGMGDVRGHKQLHDGLNSELPLLLRLLHDQGGSYHPKTSIQYIPEEQDPRVNGDRQGRADCEDSNYGMVNRPVRLYEQQENMGPRTSAQKVLYT
ncbi:C2 protein [Duck circovirus]|uniref:C2 protein n=1 Tax=Duck circovirus TaxID=324685 RepID=D0V3X7_9CIRC|nr:C2 protein [Duck circovirus]